MRDRARVDVDDGLAVPVDDQATIAGDLADRRSLDVPLAADLEESLGVGGIDDGHHPFLRLAHQDLFGGQRGVAKQHLVEFDVHAPVTRGRQFGGRARDPGGAEVLDTAHDTGREQFEGALDQQFLHERIADLNAGPLGRAVLVEGDRGQDRGAADAVAAGAGAVEDHQVPRADRLGEMEVLMTEYADAQGVDQRVAEVGLVEDHLAADVRQPEAVAVAADAGNDPRQDPVGVLCIEGAEAERVHDGNRARTHREDVADDPADPGCCALIGLDVRRVVVALDLERDGVPLADVDDAGVLPDPSQHLACRGLLGDLRELLEMHLRGLVGAVLAPHHRIHRQLGAGRATTEDLVDLGVLVLLQAQLGPRLLAIRIQGRSGHGVDEWFGHGRSGISHTRNSMAASGRSPRRHAGGSARHLHATI